MNSDDTEMQPRRLLPQGTRAVLTTCAGTSPGVAVGSGFTYAVGHMGWQEGGAGGAWREEGV